MQEKTKDKILFIKHANSRFVLGDQQFLEEKARVKPFLLDQNRTKYRYFLRLISFVIFICLNSRNTRVMMTWFADYHAAIMVFLGKIFKIKVVIFLGGQDTISYPELGKGIFNKPLRGKMAAYAIKKASLLILNHKSLLYHENFYYDPAGKKDGIQYYIPGLKTPYKVIFNGIDTSKFFRDPSIAKDEMLVLTVGTMNTEADFYNKGFDLFIGLARRNPELRFVLMGLKKEYEGWVSEKYHTEQIPNLTIICPFIPDNVLFEYYNRAKVFVQASITEGMPNTLSEAMLCECIPVGSNVNGIPDAMGNTGIIVFGRSVEELNQAVSKAVLMNTGLTAREYAHNNFSLEKRKREITDVLNQL